MYEHILATVTGGITDIDLIVTTDDSTTEQITDDLYDSRKRLQLTVTFAVTTDTEGWISINPNGIIDVAMGGLGLTDDELDDYIKIAATLHRQLAQVPPATYATSREYLAADNPEELSDDTVIIPATELGTPSLIQQKDTQ